MAYTVKELSRLAGVSARTLHHYDQIGLLEPAYYKNNGYRYYEENELIKLQQIMFFKELDFSLKDIKLIMKSSKYDVLNTLIMQKDLLAKKAERLQNLQKTLDKTILKIEGEFKMEHKNYFENFSDEKIEKYKKEARELYGDEIVDISEERTKNYTKEDFSKLQEEYHIIFSAIADNMSQGIHSQVVQEEVKNIHEIARHFWPCEKEHFVGIGEMYKTHPDFIKLYKKYDEKLPEFLYEAIKYYCEK